MLDKELLGWNYYEKKIPLYILNSYGVQEFFKIMVEFLSNQDFTEDEIIKAFNIYDKDYISFMKGYDEGGYNFVFLDGLGYLYGINRAFGVDYLDDSGNITHKDLFLNNEELLTLIKVRIIQNNFNGTYEEVRSLYDDINLPVYLLQSQNPAEAFVYISTFNPDGTPNDMSSNIKDMIYAGLFTIKSMGITYYTYIKDVIHLGIWDSESANRKWDNALWN